MDKLKTTSAAGKLKKKVKEKRFGNKKRKRLRLKVYSESVTD